MSIIRYLFFKIKLDFGILTLFLQVPVILGIYLFLLSFFCVENSTVRRRWAKLFLLVLHNAGEYWKADTIIFCSANRNQYYLPGRQFCNMCPKLFKQCILFDPGIPLLGFNSKQEYHVDMHRDLANRVSRAVLLI